MPKYPGKPPRSSSRLKGSIRSTRKATRPDSTPIKIVVNDINKAYQEKDADLLLISSDEVGFKVHSYYLAAAR